MVWLFQQIWLWVLISALFGFATTLAAVLERRDIDALRPVIRGRHGTHELAPGRSEPVAAAPADVEIEPLIIGAANSGLPADVEIEPFDPARS